MTFTTANTCDRRVRTPVRTVLLLTGAFVLMSHGFVLAGTPQANRRIETPASSETRPGRSTAEDEELRKALAPDLTF